MVTRGFKLFAAVPADGSLFLQASIAPLFESNRLQDVPFIAFRDVGNGGEDGTVSRKIEHLLVRKPAMPDRSLAVDIRELQGAFLSRNR